MIHGVFGLGDAIESSSMLGNFGNSCIHKNGGGKFKRDTNY